MLAANRKLLYVHNLPFHPKHDPRGSATRPREHPFSVSSHSHRLVLPRACAFVVSRIPIVLPPWMDTDVSW